MPEIMPGSIQNESTGRINGIGIAALSMWPAAFLVFLGHVSHLIFGRACTFTLTIIWLIGVGCLGAPFYGVRALGRRLTPHTCRFFAGIFAGITVLLTILFIVGEERASLPDMTFALILPMALAVQSYNAADALGRLESVRAAYRIRIDQQNALWHAAAERARTQHVETCAIAEHARQRELAEVVDVVMGLNDGDAHVVQLALDRRAAAASSRDEPQLHVVHLNGSDRRYGS